MRSDLDEQDLYPPDAEDTELTAEAKNHRMRAAVGATLLTWGMSLIIQRALRVDLDTFVLGLGVGALAGWSQLRRYNWFVIGAIAAGLGVAEVAGAIVGGAFGSAVASLAVAAGFAAIYVRYPRRSTWALVPAAVMALIAAGAFGVGLIGLLPAVLGRFLLPLLLVGGGGLLLFRHSLPPKTVKIGLAALAVTFVLVGANSVPEIDQDPDLNLGINPPFADGQTVGLPSLAGRTLVIEGDTGDVTFGVAEDGEARVVSRHERPGPPAFGFSVEDDDDQVIVRSSQHGPRFSGRSEPDLTVLVPEGVEVEVRRRSGTVGGMLVGGRGSITTESGDIRLTIAEGGDEGYDDDGPYEIRSETGAVRIDGRSPLVLDIESDDGAIWVDGDVDGDEYDSPDGSRGIEVEIDSERGPVRVESAADGAGGSPPESTTPTSAPVPS